MSASILWAVLAIGTSVVVSSTACSGGRSEPRSTDAASSEAVIRITGSDTMVNLVQAWAENYKQVRPDSFRAGHRRRLRRRHRRPHRRDSRHRRRQSRDESRRDEAREGTTTAHEPQEFTVALDALAVYVHKDNPLDCDLHRGTRRDLRRAGDRFVKWSQLGITNPACKSDQIIRVGRQNSSGTYAYFRDVVLGGTREYKTGLHRPERLQGRGRARLTNTVCHRVQRDRIRHDRV